MDSCHILGQIRYPKQLKYTFYGWLLQLGRIGYLEQWNTLNGQCHKIREVGYKLGGIGYLKQLNNFHWQLSQKDGLDT